MLLSHGGMSSGTCSATWMPCRSSASRLRGLLDISRTDRTPRSWSISGGDARSPGVHRQTEGEVRLDGVQPLRLQCHRPQLGEEPDTAALVPPEVDDHARPFGNDRAQRRRQLVAALAVLGTEGVPGQALRVQPGEDPVPAQVAVDQGDLFVTAVVVQIADRLELSVHGGQRRIHDAFHTGPPQRLLAEYAYFFCHDSRVPKQRRKAVTIWVVHT